MEDTERLEECLIAIHSRLSKLEQKIDPVKIEKILNSICAKLQNFEKNADKFDSMYKELNGSVIRCRALFDDRKNNTPFWYEISKVKPPEKGQIWVKDLEGNQIMARCEGLAITYPTSEFFKYPEFWKPI